MPRARLSNASFIASAEYPILPFLAPRVFVESPITRRSPPQYGRQKRSQKEEAKSDTDEVRLNATRNKSMYRPSVANTSCGEENVAGGLLQSYHSRWQQRHNSPHPDPIERRYTEISAFAHRLIRGYRTLQYRRVPHSTKSGATGALQQETERPVNREPLVRKQRMLTLASRREAALRVERERLAKLLAIESDHEFAALLRNGQYRSLSRRIINLQRWNETQLDLSERRGNAKVSFALIRAFAALDRTLYPGIGQHTRKIMIKHDARCPKLSMQLFRGMKRQSVRQIWERWMALKTTFRQGIYQRLLIYLLDRKPARALQFIQVLSHDHLLHGQTEAIADGLGHLSKLHKRGTYDVRHGWDQDKSIVKQKFVATFVAIFEQSLAVQRKACSQDLLYNIAIIATGKDLKKVWASLCEHRAYMGYETILHYANSFAKAGDTAAALQCLEHLKAIQGSNSWEATSDRQRLRWTCALILRESMSKSQDYHETPDIVATIVGLCIKMDLLLYNVVMHNAMEASDYSTAFKVYNTLEDNGLKADNHTYSILLHGCTVQNNPAMFSQFAQHCADVALDIADSWLATDYLYYLYICRHNDSDKAHTAALLRQAYVRFFPSSSLERLRKRSDGVSYTSTAGSLANTTSLVPPPAAIYIMLQADIQEALSVSTRHVSALYARFRSLVQESSDPAFIELARDPVIWNAFLFAFCQKQQFASASQLLKDMTEGSPKPNIYSWNIFMQTFFKTGQVQAAERVFEIMRSRGVDPDQFTYGILLRGYAKAQQVERIGEIMQHTDAEQEMEPGLLRALAQITNRDMLMSTLETVRGRKEVEARQKADQEAEAEEKRWASPIVAIETAEQAQSTASESTSDELRKMSADQITDVEMAELGKRLDLSLKEQLSLNKAKTAPEPSARSISESKVSPIRETSENFRDPEIQYRKLQEQLGLVASVAPIQEEAISPSQPNTSFGLSLGHKKAHGKDEAEEDAQAPNERPRWLRRVGKPTGSRLRNRSSTLAQNRRSK
ncbi:hypothetical protein DE146DRAFT_724859 [Phaeosphaeria sp. MPI-PUGE-AT-0046c]|nr:hypothetical protein DE146DRAFT_724859 [Phaeosphaeria sp. MPI-PUGE-AT-0046c]